MRKSLERVLEHYREPLYRIHECAPHESKFNDFRAEAYMYITSSHAGLTLRNNAQTFSVTFIFVGRLVGSLASLSLGLGNSACPFHILPGSGPPLSPSCPCFSRRSFSFFPHLVYCPTRGFSFGAFVPFPVGSRDFRKGLLPTNSSSYGTFMLFGEHRSKLGSLRPRVFFFFSFTRCETYRLNVSRDFSFSF